MNSFRTLVLLILLAVVAVGGGCSNQLTGNPAISSAAETDPATAEAMARIEKMPESPLGYRDLAAIYIRKARETGDPAFHSKAQLAVDQGLVQVPNDIRLLQMNASLHISGHRFPEALAIGKQLEKEAPNDQIVLAILTDANAEMGNYDVAVEYAQKMVDLKPNSLSYARAAYLRSLHGDHAGAVEIYKMAARTADPADREAQAWCLSQLGSEYWRNGRYKEAEAAFDEALSVLDGYYLAVAGKGYARAAQNDLPGAVQYLSAAQSKVPDMNTIIYLGDVYTRMGDTAKAKEQYDLVQGGEERLGDFHDAHRLALFWADRDMNLDEALQIAHDDHAILKDIYASDTLAWCLYKKERFADARIAINEALRINSNDARLYYHAGMIEMKLDNQREAKIMLQKALDLNPAFDLIKAESAQSVLNGLS